MSLQPKLEYTVPEQTARIAKAAFPKSTLCMKIYDHLGTIFRDQDFADIFPRRGQPARSPFRLALITILQFVEGLSDRTAADAVRSRIDWKYLLCLALDDPGFDFSVLSEFRARLLEKEQNGISLIVRNRVTGLDPSTLALATLLLLAVAALAGWLPARRAARINPIYDPKNKKSRKLSLVPVRRAHIGPGGPPKK